MDTKKIPPLIMLLGCLAAAIASYINHYTLKKMLITVLWVLIVFYILGIIAKVLFDKYIPPESLASGIDDDGSVIEKQIEGGEEFITEGDEEIEGSFNEIEEEEVFENPEESV